MPFINKPITRSKQLRKLSREHHQILLFVWKIRQGITLGIEVKRIASYCTWYWNNHMNAHSKKEDLLLTRIISPTKQLMNNMIEDHEAIRTKIDEVMNEPSYDSLKRLADIIYYHVRFEERVLFPAIERTATPDQLDAISFYVDDEHVTAEWQDEFWRAATPDKKLNNDHE